MTPLLALQEIAEGIASQASLHNQALREFEARTVRVLSKTTNAPPGSPVESDSYIIPTGSPMSWLGAANQIATYIGGAWSYYTPVEGVTVWVNDLDAAWAYNGTAWVVAGGGFVSPLTTKGDLHTYSTVDARLAVGANNTVLTADSAEATGVKWAANTGGIVKWGSEATRVGDALTINTFPTTTAYVDGETYIFTLLSGNVGNATLKVDALAVKTITKEGGNPLVADDLIAGANMVTYTATPSQFKLHRSTPSSFVAFTAVVGGVAGTAATHLIIKSQLDAKAYGGRITNAGTAAVAYGPTGWTVSRTSTGITVVTHSLGTTNYACSATATNSLITATVVTAINSFTVTTVTSTTGAVADGDYGFVVARN